MFEQLQLADSAPVDQANTKMIDPVYTQFRDLTRFWVQRVAVPIIMVIGLFGNLITMIIMTRRRMRSTTNLYLAALAFVDMLYLVLTFVLGLSHYPNMAERKYQIYWQLRPFLMMLTDACSNTSVWLTVTFTIERFIAVRYPMKGKVWCTEARAKRLILAVFAFAIGFALPVPFEWKIVERKVESRETNESGQQSGGSSEGPREKIVLALDNTDFGQDETYKTIYYRLTAIMFYFLPLISVTLFNGFLIHSVHKSRKERNRMTNQHMSASREQLHLSQTKKCSSSAGKLYSGSLSRESKRGQMFNLRGVVDGKRYDPQLRFWSVADSDERHSISMDERAKRDGWTGRGAPARSLDSANSIRVCVKLRSDTRHGAVRNGQNGVCSGCLINAQGEDDDKKLTERAPTITVTESANVSGESANFADAQLSSANHNASTNCERAPDSGHATATAPERTAQITTAPTETSPTERRANKDNGNTNGAAHGFTTPASSEVSPSALDTQTTSIGAGRSLRGGSLNGSSPCPSIQGNVSITSAGLPPPVTAASNQERRITIMLIAVVLLFLVCQIPSAAMLLYTSVYETEPNTNEHALLLALGNIFNFLMAINAAGNFILYSFLSKKYRRTFVIIFCSCFKFGPSCLSTQNQLRL